MPAAYPSAVNTYVRSHEASGKLVVDYARNIDDFAVNKYAQIVPAKKKAGWYLKMTIEEAGRILDSTLDDHAWADGTPAPEGNNGLESFEYLPFLCRRYIYPVLFGDQTIDQADWDILAQHASIKARQAMTARTQLVATQLTTSGNYAAAHTADVASGITGNTGRWNASTTARMDIKRSLMHAQEVILDSTLAAVDTSDLQLVINSQLAGQLSVTQEITDYVKSSPDAYAQVKGELSGQNANVPYGLPAKLYGINLVVEKTRKVTSKKGATDARSQIWPNASAVLCARPGGLEGVEGAPSFSTVTLFAHEEMTAETLKDPNNRRTVARVVEDITAVMTAPVSGFLFTNCMA